MAGAKLLLFPSEWYETFGRTVIEAISVGTPVVCSRGGAHTELVSEGVTGTTLASGADSRGWLCGDAPRCRPPDRYAAMRRNAREAYLREVHTRKASRDAARHLRPRAAVENW